MLLLRFAAVHSRSGMSACRVVWVRRGVRKCVEPRRRRWLWTLDSLSGFRRAKPSPPGRAQGCAIPANHGSTQAQSEPTGHRMHIKGPCRCSSSCMSLPAGGHILSTPPFARESCLKVCASIAIRAPNAGKLPASLKSTTQPDKTVSKHHKPKFCGRYHSAEDRTSPFRTFVSRMNITIFRKVKCIRSNRSNRRVGIMTLYAPLVSRYPKRTRGTY